jgi:hypothetical protein
VTPETCDCGHPLAHGDQACATCRYLDGRTPSEQQLIAALRSLGGRATSPALRLESALPERTLRRVLAQLRALGRIITTTDPDDDGRAEHQLVSTP